MRSQGETSTSGRLLMGDYSGRSRTARDWPGPLTPALRCSAGRTDGRHRRVSRRGRPIQTTMTSWSMRPKAIHRHWRTAVTWLCAPPARSAARATSRESWRTNDRSPRGTVVGRGGCNVLFAGGSSPDSFDGPEVIRATAAAAWAGGRSQSPAFCCQVVPLQSPNNSNHPRTKAARKPLCRKQSIGGLQGLSGGIVHLARLDLGTCVAHHESQARVH